MKIVNGKGKIGKNGKYIVSPLDRIESKKLIKVLFAEVESILTKKFGSVVFVDGEEKPKYNKTIEQANGYLFTPSISIDSQNFRTNRSAFINVDTGVNENGYGKNTIKRHFVISFELKGSVRLKFQKKWNKDSIIIKRYALADNMNDVLEEFKDFLANEYDNFFTGRMLKNLEQRR